MQLDFRYSTLLVLRYTDTNLQQNLIQSLDSTREAVVEETVVPGVIYLTTLAQLAFFPPHPVQLNLPTHSSPSRQPNTSPALIDSPAHT